jgi:hypothetical protein
MSQTAYTYFCEKCNYSTTRKFNYLKHIKTDKHSFLCSESQTNVVINNSTSSTNLNYQCPKCERKYTLKRNLWRHVNQCQNELKQTPTSIDTNDDTNDDTNISMNVDIPSDTNDINTNSNTNNVDYGKLILEVIKSNQILQSQMLELLKAQKPNTSNTIIQGDVVNTTNTFNLNMFLNEKCKDAMNMTEFAQSIEVTMENMDNIRERGYVECISAIFIDNLKNTEINKRPIHCSDLKREVLYVKDDDSWEREDVNSKKLKDAVLIVEHKHAGMINKWADEHPGWDKSNNIQNNKYWKMCRNISDGTEAKILKVVKNIAKESVIKKGLLK